MEPSTLIKMNTKVDLAFKDDGEDYMIPCEIIGFTKDTVMLEYPPAEEEIVSEMKIGVDVELLFYTEEGVVVMQAKTKNKVLDEAIVTSYPVEKERIQRREYFRVYLQRKIEIKYHDGERICKYEGKTIDLSGGGVRFWTSVPLQPGFSADISLHIEDLSATKDPIRASGKILYTKPVEEKPKGYISVIKFADITPRTRQLIMKACFKLQLEMRKNRLKD
jgi:c-di-GMP-binding flagellar brake protein YcgR